MNVSRSTEEEIRVDHRSDRRIPGARRSATAVLVGIVLGLFGCGAKPTPTDDVGRRAEIDRLFEEIRERYPDVPPIDRAEVRELGERVVLVDVRPEEERSVSTIAGAITREAFEAESAEERGSRVVVTYCTVGERSGRYARELREQGLDARNLAGGILEWTHEGGTLVGPDGQTTKRAHVYGPRWDLLPDGYEAVVRD